VAAAEPTAGDAGDHRVRRRGLDDGPSRDRRGRGAQRDGSARGAWRHGHHHRSNRQHRHRAAAECDDVHARPSTGILDVETCRSEFGRVPPRSLVRGQGTWLHEDEIVQRISQVWPRAALRGAGSIRCQACNNPATVMTGSESPSRICRSVAYDWAIRPQCGAVVLFSGTIRNHAEGRDGVEHLTYEAYEEQVVPRFAEIGAEAARRWPDTDASRCCIARPHRDR
jgi:hypothetical protein